DALNGVRVIVLAKNAFALLVTERGTSQVAYQHRRTVDLCDHGRADIVQGVHQSDAAHDVALVAARHAPAAGIGVVVVDGVDDIGDAQAIVLQLTRIEV